MSNKSNFWVSTLSGGIAGGIELLCIWPMEYIKTQLQLQERNKLNKFKYNGTFDGIRWTVKNNGFLGLYRGLAPILAMSIPKAGIRFGMFSYIQNLLKDDEGNISVEKNLLAGMVAGATEASLVVTPTETIKTRLIQDNKSLLKGCRFIFRQEGIRGFYKGFSSTILKQSTNQGIRFTVFNLYKDYLTDNGIKMTPINNFGGGALAGLIGVCINNPFDVVKTKMQGSESIKYKNTFMCFKNIIQNEKISVLWRGAIPRMYRVVPGQGIMFMTYSTIKLNIDKLIN